MSAYAYICVDGPYVRCEPLQGDHMADAKAKIASIDICLREIGRETTLHCTYLWECTYVDKKTELAIITFSIRGINDNVLN